MVSSSPYNKHGHNQIKICVSGAADTSSFGLATLDIAKELGREVARQGAVLVTGATTGFPLWAAMGAKEEGGISIGFSPAASEKEHLEVYKLPIDYMDLIIYTGFGYSGRDLFLTRSSDGAIFGCGRIGTIHEFTITFEDYKPMGILEGPWETGPELKDIILKSHRANDRVIYGDNPKKIVEDVIALIKKYKLDEINKKPI